MDWISAMKQFCIENPYTGILLAVWGTGMGFPVPEDIILLMAGWLCAHDNPATGEPYANVWWMIFWVYLCIIASDSFIYYLGWRYGHHVPKFPLIRVILTEKKMAMAEAAFLKHGNKTVFITRLTPLIRAPIYFTAGAFKMPLWKFVFFDGLAALIGTPVVIFAGYFFGDQWDALVSASHTVQTVVIIGVLSFLAILAFIHLRQKRKLIAEAKELDAQLHHHLKNNPAAPLPDSPKD